MPKPSLHSLQKQEQQRETQTQHELIRGAELTQRRSERMRLSLPVRLARALAQAQVLSEGFSGSYEAQGARQAPSSSPPRPTEGVYDTFHRRIALMIRNFEDEVDLVKLRAYGHSLTREERLKRLLSLDYEGMHAEEVAFIDPSLGSVLSIRRERNAAGRDYLGQRIVSRKQ